MNWNIALACIIITLGAIVVWLILEIRQLDRVLDWELGATDCPLSKGPMYLTKVGPEPGETVWDQLIRDEGDPADISTTGAEFAMPGK